MSIGLIVGSGMDFLSDNTGWLQVSTPFGDAYLAKTTLGDRDVFILRRHGPGLNVPPHLINYHANISALMEMGVDRIMATAAVGSLKKDLAPGTLAVVNDVIDFTKHRTTTIFDRPGKMVVHVDFSMPYCSEISAHLLKAAADQHVEMNPGVVYLCVDGPRYETPAEVRMFAKWGADVVGMTGVPEVVLAKEMGVCYGSLAIVTNYAAGISEMPLSHHEVLACVTNRREEIRSVMEAAVRSLPERRICCSSQLDTPS